jgi:hypothetical protein
MLRKLILPLLIFCVTDAVAQHNQNASSKTTQKNSDADIDYKQVGAPMPSLTFLPYYDTSKKDEKPKGLMTDKDFDNGADLFVIMFNPTCSHCQNATILLRKNKDLFKKTKVILLANNVMKDYLHDFVTMTGEDQAPFMYLGIDSSQFINSTFLYQSLPQINIYSGDRKLIRTYTGDVAIDSLKKYIQ